MTGDALRTIVWEKMIESEMRAYYFAELANSYRNWAHHLTFAILLLTSGAAVSAALGLPASFHWVAVLLPLVAAALSAWMLVKAYIANAASANDLHAQWARVAAQYEELWNDVDSQEAPASFQRLLDRGQELSKMGTIFPAKNRRLEHWLAYASERYLARYA
jgi:hypothetical protein